MRAMSSAEYCKHLTAYKIKWLLLLSIAVVLTGHTRQMGTVRVEPEERRISASPGDFEFDVTHHSIPFREIRGGGPSKDGIPALVEPVFDRERRRRETIWKRTYFWKTESIRPVAESK